MFEKTPVFDIVIDIDELKCNIMYTYYTPITTLRVLYFLLFCCDNLVFFFLNETDNDDRIIIYCKCTRIVSICVDIGTFINIFTLYIDISVVNSNTYIRTCCTQKTISAWSSSCFVFITIFRT